MITNMTITANEPVLAEQRGTGGKGIVWLVQPKNFGNLSRIVLKHGGPDMWGITPLSELSPTQLRKLRKAGHAV